MDSCRFFVHYPCINPIFSVSPGVLHGLIILDMSKAILLVNLGSPDSPAVPDVRRYLNEFLMDERVIDVPWLMRRFIVGMILINRPKESAHAYQSIWTKEGSPLVVISRNVQKRLQARVSVPVELAMRYQKPSIESAIRKLAGQGIDDVLLIPLFPHYAMSSYETAVVRVQELAGKLAPKMKITVQRPYGDAPDYIAALVASAGRFLQQEFDYLLFSFHGVPERQIKKSDPTHAHCLATSSCCSTPSEAHKFCYRHQCFRTAEEFAKAAKLPAGKWSVSFQSRLGKDPWLKPYTDFELERLAKNGVKKILVLSPAFVSDCLETVEELGIRGKQTFLEAGGGQFQLIPCLNEHPAWIAALENMAKKFLAPAQASA
jgi:protoporphyrin/coproporphyrin ferrochelatase